MAREDVGPGTRPTSFLLLLISVSPSFFLSPSTDWQSLPAELWLVPSLRLRISVEPGQTFSFLSPVRVHDGPAVVYGDVDGASSHQLGLPGVGHLLLTLLGLHHDGDVPDLLPEDVAPPLPGWRRRSAWQEGSS